MKIKIVKSDNDHNISEEQVINSLSLIADVLNNYELDEDKKKLCRRGNAWKDAFGRFSTKKNAKSWSVRVGGKDCQHGQTRMNPRRWTKIPCGRKDRDNPNVKADYKCKDGKRTDEYLAPVNCKTTDVDKTFKKASKNKPASITIDQKKECGVKNMKINKPLLDKIRKVKEYEKQFSGPNVEINKQFLDRVIDYINDNPPKPKNIRKEDNKMNTDDRKDELFSGWRDFLRLSRGIV